MDDRKASEIKSGCRKMVFLSPDVARSPQQAEEMEKHISEAEDCGNYYQNPPQYFNSEYTVHYQPMQVASRY